MRRAASRLLSKALQADCGSASYAASYNAYVVTSVAALQTPQGAASWGLVQLTAGGQHRLHSALAAVQPADEGDAADGEAPSPRLEQHTAAPALQEPAAAAGEATAAVAAPQAASPRAQQPARPRLARPPAAPPQAPPQLLKLSEEQWQRWVARPLPPEREHLRNRPPSWKTQEDCDSYFLTMDLLHRVESCEELLDRVRQVVVQRPLNVRELTVACSRMGRLYTSVYHRTGARKGDADNNTTHCAAMYELALPLLAAADTQAVATVLWMCSRFHNRPPVPQRADLEAALWERRHTFNFVETSNILFSLGVLYWCPTNPELVEAMLDRVLRRPNCLTPWMVCNMLWGCARLSRSNPLGSVSFHPGESRVDALLRAVLPKLPTFLPESFTSILFSLACLGCRPGDGMLSTLLEAMEPRLGEFSARQLVIAAWALGLLQLGPTLGDSLWRRLCDSTLGQADNFRPPTAPLLLLGAALLEMPPTAGSLELALRKTQEFGGQLRLGDVIVTLWSLMKLGHRKDSDLPPGLCEGLTQRYLEVSQEQAPTLRQVAAFLLANSDLGHSLGPRVLARCIQQAEEALAQGGCRLTRADAGMLITAFERQGSEAGLDFMRRHLMDAEELEEGSQDLGVDLADAVRPSGLVSV